MADDARDRMIASVVKQTLAKTVKLRVTATQTDLRGAGGRGNLKLEQSYAETSLGERYFEQRRIDPGGATTYHSADYRDGKKCASVTFSPAASDTQGRVVVGHGFGNEANFAFRDAPEPLRWYHVGLTPLHEALPAAERAGQERVLERTCDNFQFKGVGRPARPIFLVYSLDEATGVPLKICAYYDADHLRDHVQDWVWEAATLDRVGDRHFARNSTYRSFVVKKAADGSWESRPDISSKIEVKEIAFDEPIPKTSFWPTVEPGVLVLDATTKKKRVTSGEKPAAQKTTTPETPIRVAPDTGSWLPGIGVVLSIAVLGVAALLWRRSR